MPSIPHKSDVGRVLLNLAYEAAVRAAFDKLHAVDMRVRVEA